MSAESGANTRVGKHARRVRGAGAALVAASVLVAGLGIAAPTASAASAVTITPNPWAADTPFEGWGTSLAWFANATGDYGEPGSIVHSSGNAEADKKALAYGKKLKNELYDAIFGKDGLRLNMARYNIGGGNASDVAYGYPFMRQGAAVPGYWKDDAKAAGTYKDASGSVSTKQADKDRLDSAFDPTDDADYDWSKGSAQEWWLNKGVSSGDMSEIELFANSAPWFMTRSGYATGGYDSGANNLSDPQKFAEYLAHVTRHLEKKYNFDAQTVEPLNESETSYWGTPRGTAAARTDSGEQAGIDQSTFDYYWNTHFNGKDKSVTPYSGSLKKPQEGMHVDYAQGSSSPQQKTIAALRAALAAEGSRAKISSTDATNTDDLLKSYKLWDASTRDAVGQYNSHAYSTPSPQAVRDLAQADNKSLSMSEVDGSWQSGSFDPYNSDFSNALGMARQISSNVWSMQSKDFTFWQVVEDLYNMGVGTDKDLNGNTAKVYGENTNWGTVLVDFDCTVAGTDGRLYSERDWLNNGKKTDGIHPCSVVANTKYAAVRAYTQLIRPGARIIANNDPSRTMTAIDKNGKDLLVVYTNDGDEQKNATLDLSNFSGLSSSASARMYVTTAPQHGDDPYDSTVSVITRTSNVEQPASAVSLDTAAKKATFTLPARSIVSLRISGTSGIADKAAALKDGSKYQIRGVQSQKVLSASADGSGVTIEDQASTTAKAGRQGWTAHKAASPSARPDVRTFTFEDGDGRFLVADGSNLTVKKQTAQQAASDPSSRWMLNTEDGSTWELTNEGSRTALDVGNQNTAAGSAVDLWQSNAGANQRWTFASITPSVRPLSVQTAVGVMPALPETVTPVYDGKAGTPVPVTWQTGSLAQQVKKPGTYTVTGSATDLFGTTIPVTLRVYVGVFTWAEPGSLTAARGTARQELEAAAPTSVRAHVGASDAIASPVTWDWSTYKESGTDRAVVSGTASDGAGGSLPATLTVIFVGQTTTDGTNLARTFCDAAHVSASSTENGHPATDTCDGSRDKDHAWSNWKQDQTDHNPTLTYTFDTAHKLHSVKLWPTSPAEATPSAFSVDYLQADGTWKDSGIRVDGITDDADPAVADVSSLPATKGIRLRLTYYQPDGYYAKVGEVGITEEKTVPQKASVADLADLRQDGVSVTGFDPATTSYTGTIAQDAAWPLIQAAPVDTGARVDIVQPSDDTDGTATITVTAADGTTRKVYTLALKRTEKPGESIPWTPLQPSTPAQPDKPGTGTGTGGHGTSTPSVPGGASAGHTASRTRTAAAASSRRGGLSSTGSAVVGIIAAAVVLLMAGAGVIAARRRSAERR